MPTETCSRCDELEARLRDALEERDALLLELARLGETRNAEALRERWAHEAPIPNYPLQAGTAWPVPLRYRVVDAAHSVVKRTLPGTGERVRKLLGRVLER